MRDAEWVAGFVRKWSPESPAAEIGQQVVSRMRPDASDRQLIEAAVAEVTLRQVRETLGSFQAMVMP